MVAQSWTFKVDTKRTGTFAANIDDLTSRLIGQTTWNEGMASAFQEFAPPSTLTVQLDNIDGAFNLDTLGSELLTNGDFSSWSGGNPSSWTVTGEVASDPEISQVGQSALHGGSGTGACNFYATSATVSISQVVLTIGSTYCVTIDISASDGGTGWIAIYDNVTRVSPYYHVTGKKTIYFNAASTTLAIASSGAVNMTVDSVSCKQTALYAPLLTEGTLGRLYTTYSLSTYTHFKGKLTGFTITAGSISRRVATLTFSDIMLDLLDTEYIPTLLTNVGPEVPIAAVLDNPVVPYPYANSYWILEAEGSSELDLSTLLYVAPTYTLNPGKSSYSWVGDNSIDNSQVQKGISAQSYLRDAVNDEIGGAFFWNHHNGGFEFDSRDSYALNYSSFNTLTETDYDPDLSVYMRSQVINKSTVSFTPRKTGTAGSIIWSTDKTIGMYNEVKTITARYRDLSNPSARVGATDIIPLFPGTDYIIVRDDGTDISTSVGVNMVAGANSATITIDNSHNNFTVHVTVLQIRGTPLTTFNPQTVNSQNKESQRDYHFASEQLNLKLVDDVNIAQSIADYRVYKFSSPSNYFDKLGIVANKSDTRMQFCVTALMNRRFTITDSWLGHSADYYIVGRRCTIAWGGDNTFTVIFQLKPADKEAYWMLDTSLLGVDTRLFL